MTNKEATLKTARHSVGTAISAARFALSGLQRLHDDPHPDPAQAEAAAVRLATVFEAASVHAYIAADAFKCLRGSL
jgi:hypothetical protein